MRPIEEIERDLRRTGSFLLVDPQGRLQYYGRKFDSRLDLVKEMTPRTAEMINFLKAQAKG